MEFLYIAILRNLGLIYTVYQWILIQILTVILASAIICRTCPSIAKTIICVTNWAIWIITLGRVRNSFAYNEETQTIEIVEMLNGERPIREAIYTGR